MIAIIGAGISGLASALTLQRLGHSIVIIDKGRSVGGRLATRYFESHGVKRYIDTASHYIELKDETPSIKKLLLSLYPDQASQSKIVGPAGINSIAKTLSEQLKDVQIVLSHKVNSLVYNSSSKQFHITAVNRAEEKTFDVDAVILTAPVPQSIDLLSHFPKLAEQLRQAPSYHRCLLLLLWPKSPLKAESLNKPAFIDRIVSQTHIKANSEPLPIAVHATYAWSDEHYALPDEQIMELLVKGTGINKTDFDCIQVKRWGQAQPTKPISDTAPGYQFDSELNLVVCSDALGTGNIHSAGESGIHAANELSSRLRNSQTSKM